MNLTRELGIFSVFTYVGISAHVALSIRALVVGVDVGAIVWTHGGEYGLTGTRAYLAEKNRDPV